MAAKLNNLDNKYRTIIEHFTVMQMVRFFLLHCPIGCKGVKGMKIDTSKKHHDRVLRDIPDTPKRDNYGASVSAKTCSITKQKNW